MAYSYNLELIATHARTLALVQMVEVSVISEYDTYGAVRDGRLIIRGMLRTPERYDTLELSGLENCIYEDWKFVSREFTATRSTPWTLGDDIRSSRMDFDSRVNHDSVHPPPADQAAYLPTILRYGAPQSSIVGLVLERVPGRNGTFPRIGRFETALYAFGSGGYMARLPGRETGNGDPIYDLRKYWEWGLLSRTDFGEDEPLFEFDTETSVSADIPLIKIV